MAPPDLQGSTQEGPHSPAFLLSTERSGSNLLRSILHAHPDVAAPHPLETAYPWRNMAPPIALSRRQRRAMCRDVLVNKNYSFHPLVDGLSVGAVHERVEAAEEKSFLTVQEALYGEYADTVEASTWVSKDPSQWDYLDALLSYYDDPRFVYLVRDARDVVLSFANSNVGEYHPYFAATRWRDEQSRGREFLTEHEGRVHLVRYRDLLQDPETEVRAVCDFLDLPFAERMLYYYNTAEAQQASEQAGAFENLSVPIKSDNYDKFRDAMAPEDVRLVEAVAGEELAGFDFALTTDEAAREAVEIDVAAFETAERKRARSNAIDYWRTDTREQLLRSAGQSFSVYMILRYGLLSGLSL